MLSINKMEIFATTPKQMAVRYVVATGLLVMLIINAFAFGDHYMCTESLADEIIVRDCILWADIGEFIVKPAVIVFIIFQAILSFLFMFMLLRACLVSFYLAYFWSF